MRRLALVLLLVAAVSLGGGMSTAAVGSKARPSAAALEGQLVCPTCKETLDESDSPIARRMKAYIRKRIADGASGDQIKRELVAQFGESVLATPPTKGLGILAWVLPVGGAVAGGAVLGWVAWTWSRRRDGGPPDSGGGGELDPELERRVDEALATFED
jgi:cytochrome c-type biogenesis protein CcmH